MVDLFGMSFSVQSLIIGGLIAVGLILLVSFIFFRKYFSALVTDYVYDGVFSFVDEILGGVAFPIISDIGDYLGAWIAYKREKKEVPKRAAIFIALEAANFIVLGFVPVDWILNVIPMATILRAVYGYRAKAEKKRQKVEEEAAFAKQVGTDTSLVDERIKEMKSKDKEGDYAGEYEIAKDLEKDMQIINREAVGKQAGTVKDGIIQMLAAANEAGLSASTMADLQEGIAEIQEVLNAASQKEDYKEAMALVEQAESMRVELANIIEKEYEEAA